MKRIALFFALMVFAAGLHAQKQQTEIYIDPMLNEVLTEAQINDLRVNNPAQLVRENCNLVHYCYFAAKLTEEEGTYQMKGDLRNYVKAGKTCDYQAIISRGCINRYDYNLEQDPVKQNVYRLGNTGTYIIVLSKQNFERNQDAYLKQYGLQ